MINFFNDEFEKKLYYTKIAYVHASKIAELGPKHNPSRSFEGKECLVNVKVRGPNNKKACSRYKKNYFCNICKVFFKNLLML